jgi:Na+/H+-dicarboxylate symporter
MSLFRFHLLPCILLAIVSGIFLGGFCSETVIQVPVIFNGLFSQYLGFCIPLIIVGLVAPGIADLGNRGGKLLLLTVILAYVSTLFAGFFAYFTCTGIFPHILETITQADVNSKTRGILLVEPLFVLRIPPVFDVTSALLAAFMLGIGSTAVQSEIIHKGLLEFRGIIELVIKKTVIPLLPIHIFGLFLNMSYSGAADEIIRHFGAVVGVILVLHIILLLIQFSTAGILARKNPLKMLWIMLPAYATALGTSSSAATIPVTLNQAKKMGIHPDIADFCIPLCATIHLSGSMLKITATALAVCMLTGLPHNLLLFTGFIIILSVMMIAAPGVPGGAIMASIGILQTVLGFSEMQNSIMIAVYLAIDSIGTAGNVTGDGAIAAVIDRFSQQKG